MPYKPPRFRVGQPGVGRGGGTGVRASSAPGTIGNPLPGGTGTIPPPGQWKAADPNYEGSVWGYTPTQPSAGGDGGGGGYGGGGGFSDPGYAQFLANLRAMGALDASRRQELVQQALVRFGLVPENLKDPYGDVTDLVRKLAGEKTTAGTSTYAKIQDWNKQILSRLRKTLAARGALRSGELGFGLERQDLGYRQTFDDATSQLLDYISGAQFAFAQSELARAMQQGQYPFDPGNYLPPMPAPAPAPAPGGGGISWPGLPGGGGGGISLPPTSPIFQPPVSSPALPPGHINPGWY